MRTTRDRGRFLTGPLRRAVVDDRGAATVFGACVIAALVAVVVAMVYVGSAVVARHRAQSAADLAALAAAQRAVLALDDPCGAARDIAAATSVAMARCGVDGDDVVVVTVVHVRLGPLGAHDARAVARAGPTE